MGNKDINPTTKEYLRPFYVIDTSLLKAHFARAVRRARRERASPCHDAIIPPAGQGRGGWPGAGWGRAQWIAPRWQCAGSALRRGGCWRRGTQPPDRCRYRATPRAARKQLTSLEQTPHCHWLPSRARPCLICGGPAMGAHGIGSRRGLAVAPPLGRPCQPWLPRRAGGQAALQGADHTLTLGSGLPS